LSELTGQKSKKKSDIRATTCNPFDRKFNNPFEREKNTPVSQILSPLLPAHHGEVEISFWARYCLVLFIKVQHYFKTFWIFLHHAWARWDLQLLMLTF